MKARSLVLFSSSEPYLVNTCAGLLWMELGSFFSSFMLHTFMTMHVNVTENV